MNISEHTQGIQEVLPALSSEVSQISDVLRNALALQFVDSTQVSVTPAMASLLNNSLKSLLVIKAMRSPEGSAQESVYAFVTEDAYLAGQIAMLQDILSVLPQ